MKREQHCNNCFKKFGNAYPEVHIWLDALAGKSFPEIWHRCFRHHTVGVLQIKQMYGEEAAQAAELHIRDDMEWAGYNRNQDIPLDFEDSKRFWGEPDE